MPDPIYGLTEERKDQLLEYLRHRPGGGDPPAPVPREGNASWRFITCGSVAETAGGFRYYNGTPKIFDATAGAYTEPQGGTSDSVYLVSKVDLVSGEVYAAQGTGTRSISGTTKPCFVAEVRKFKWVMAITGEPECVDGNLEIPWEWVAVLDLGDASGFMLPPPPP